MCGIAQWNKASSDTLRTHSRTESAPAHESLLSASDADCALTNVRPLHTHVILGAEVPRTHAPLIPDTTKASHIAGPSPPIDISASEPNNPRLQAQTRPHPFGRILNISCAISMRQTCFLFT